MQREFISTVLFPSYFHCLQIDPEIYETDLRASEIGLVIRRLSSVTLVYLIRIYSLLDWWAESSIINHFQLQPSNPMLTAVLFCYFYQIHRDFSRHENCF